jgi:hypothetical protein
MKRFIRIDSKGNRISEEISEEEYQAILAEEKRSDPLFETPYFFLGVLIEENS